MLLVASLTLAGCFGKKKINNVPVAGASAEPDKALYERALEDIRKGRHGVGRLTLQTLINTYPDSEYLAKAKLAIADSYFKEGGTAGLTQAVAAAKDAWPRKSFRPFCRSTRTMRSRRRPNSGCVRCKKCWPRATSGLRASIMSRDPSGLPRRGYWK